MSDIHTLIKTFPRLSSAALENGGPEKTVNRGAHAESLLFQLARYASAIMPNLAAFEWLKKLVNERSLDEARNAFLSLSETGQAIVMNGYLIKNNGKYRLSFDGATFGTHFVLKAALKSPYEFPVTTFAAMCGKEVI
jgi:hypothetical protein